ncbi:MAG: hypothetical protein CL912_01305 [Deltaproteobacteria bacterium]|nr:hypothetical protein [Deltaproteobacteria bacterium]
MNVSWTGREALTWRSCLQRIMQQIVSRNLFLTSQKAGKFLANDETDVSDNSAVTDVVVETTHVKALHVIVVRNRNALRFWKDGSVVPVYTTQNWGYGKGHEICTGPAFEYSTSNGGSLRAAPGSSGVRRCSAPTVPRHIRLFGMISDHKSLRRELEIDPSKPKVGEGRGVLRYPQIPSSLGCPRICLIFHGQDRH